jgi:tricorn protease
MPHQSTRNVYAAVLRKDLPSPLAPESDEEKIQDAKKDAAPAAAPGASPPAPGAAGETGAAPQAAAQAAPGGPPKKEAEPVRIDFEGIDQRIVALCLQRVQQSFEQAREAQRSVDD